MQTPKDKDGSEDNKTLCSANVRKEWMNFIFNDVSEHISNNSVFSSLHFTPALFTKKAQFLTVFSERWKLKEDAVPNILDLIVIHTCE